MVVAVGSFAVLSHIRQSNIHKCIFIYSLIDRWKDFLLSLWTETFGRRYLTIRIITIFTDIAWSYVIFPIETLSNILSNILELWRYVSSNNIHFNNITNKQLKVGWDHSHVYFSLKILFLWSLTALLCSFKSCQNSVEENITCLMKL